MFRSASIVICLVLAACASDPVVTEIRHLTCPTTQPPQPPFVPPKPYTPTPLPSVWGESVW